MESIEDECPNIAISVKISNIGYRIAIAGGTCNEKLHFVDILQTQKDLYVIRKCDGARFIIRVLVILKAIYLNNEIHLRLPTNIETISNIDREQKNKIQHYLNLNIKEI